MATASAFSYAQAAKGQGTAPSNAPPGQPAQEAQPSAAAPKAATDVESAAEPTEAVRSADSPATTEKQEVASATAPEAEPRSEDAQEQRREPARDDESGRLDRPWRRNDKGTRSSSTTTRSVDEQDARRPRKSKKSKAAEKQANDQSAADKEQEPEKEAPKVELFEAPIPSVNIWRQRAEAHLAKAKPSPAPSAEQTTNGSPKPEASPKVAENGTPAPAAQRESIPNGVKPPRKSVEAPRSERNASRSSRVADKDASRGDVPPSVADTTAWPTPETAIQEDKKKPAEKSDRPEKEASEDGSSSKPRQKGKWVTMDYVPSVNFETQLPQMRNSKPRGGARNANGSRATGASNAGDKAAAPVASQGKPSETSSSSSTSGKDRPRDGANGPNRNAQAPQATSKRSSTDMSGAREQRKPQSHTGSEKNKDATTNSNVSSFLDDRRQGRGNSRTNVTAVSLERCANILFSLSFRSRAMPLVSEQRAAAIGRAEDTADVAATIPSTLSTSTSTPHPVSLLRVLWADAPRAPTAHLPGKAPMARCTCPPKAAAEAVETMPATTIGCRSPTDRHAFPRFRLSLPRSSTR